MAFRKRKLFTFVAVLPGLAICLIGFIASRWSPSDKQPRIRFKSVIHDFGTVPPQRKVITDFVFHNEGNRDLRIIGIKSSCRCAAAMLSKSVLKGGESGAIAVSLDVSETMPIARRLIVETNDPVNRQVALEVRARPQWPIDVKPKSLSLPALVEGKEATKEVEVFSPSGKAFNLVGIEVSSPNLRVEQLANSGRSQKLLVHVTPNQYGDLEEFVTIVTNVAERPSMKIPIVGNVLSKGQLRPSRLLLGKQKPGARAYVRIDVAERPVQNCITSVSSSHKDWKVISFQTNGDEMGNQRLQIELLVPDRYGFHRSSLLLSGPNSRFVVPISCYVAKAAPENSVDALTAQSR